MTDTFHAWAARQYDPWHEFCRVWKDVARADQHERWHAFVHGWFLIGRAVRWPGGIRG